MPQQLNSENAQTLPGHVASTVGLGVLVENDCEDQGYSNVSDGCNKWPCKREPLVRWALGWKCTKCGGCY
jgi:hypothetical protein